MSIAARGPNHPIRLVFLAIVMVAYTGSIRAALPPEALHQTGNLLADGSFEAGLKGWQAPSYYTAKGEGQWERHDFADYAFVTGQALDGDTHLKLMPRQTMTVTLNPVQGIKVFKGCTYSFKIHFKRELATLDVTRTTPALRVIFRDKHGTSVGHDGGPYYVYSNTQNKEPVVDLWTSEAYTFTVSPDSEVDRVDLTVYFYNAGTIELDKIGFFNETVRERAMPSEVTMTLVPVAGDEARLGLPVASVPRVTTDPVMDGKAEDALWAEVKKNLLVNSITGAKSDQATEFQIAHDSENLYLFVRAVERGQESHRHGPRDRDAAALFENDAVELFLQVPGQQPAYFQVVANPEGGLADRKWLSVGQELPWDAQGIEVEGAIHFDYWTVKIKIPFRDLGVSTPQAGELWRANVCRTELPGDRNWNAWSSTGGGYQQPDRFGLLRFSGPQRQAAELHTLRGTLVDEQGNGIPNAPVKAFGRIERTNSKGVFVFEDASAGEQYLSIISPKHQEMHGKVTLRNAVEIIAPVVVPRRDPFKPAFTGPLGAGPVAWIKTNLTEPPTLQDRPPAEGLLKSISARAARGETAAVALSLFCNQDLEAPALTIGELKDASGNGLKAKVTLCWVQRMLKPVHYQGPEDDAEFVWRFLWPEPPAAIKANQFRMLTATFDIPGQAHPGTYRGQFVLASRDKTIATLPIELTVGAFELIAPTERAGAFLNASPMRSEWERFPQWYDVVFADMQAHGATTLCWWEGINFNGKGIPSIDAASKSLALQIKYGMKPPYLIKFSLEVLAREMGVKFNDRHAMDVPSLQAQEPEFRQAVQRGVQAVRQLEQRFELERHELALIWSDEVFLKGRLEPWLYTARIVREYTDNPIALTFDTRHEDKWAQVEPLVDIPFYHGRNLDSWIDNDSRTYEALKQRLDAKGDLAITYYNITRTDITPEFARIVNGLWLWRTPINAQMHWTYFWGDMDAMQGVRAGERLAPFFALAAPHPTRPFEMVSTLDWENLREGVTDHKYITTLEHAIADTKPGKEETRQKAQALLQAMWDVDPRVSETAKVLHANDYDRRRALMYDYIEDLQE